MKTEERGRARDLRKQGISINEIHQKLGVSKGSVSVWVRDIELTRAQRQELSKKGHTKDAIEKRRISRLKNENRRRQKYIDSGVKEISFISKKELFYIGIALYWAEGAKRNRGSLQFTNSDPRMIQIMMRFFRDFCSVPQDKFRGHIHLHPHLDNKKAEVYWSEISGIPKKQLFKTSKPNNRASKNKKDTLPYGTFAIYVCDTSKYLQMMGWIEGVYKISQKVFES